MNDIINSNIALIIMDRTVYWSLTFTEDVEVSFQYVLL